VTSPLLRGRSPRGLLWFWAIGLAIAGGLFWITRVMPALDDLIRPLYWVVAIALAIFTVRWFRPRSSERRHTERRWRLRRDTPRKTPPLSR
jgi:hypothetical protein